MATPFDLLSILLTSFFLNIIPFAGPSNLFIGSNFSLLTDADPLVIGGLVALGSTSAKLIHYLVTFIFADFLGQERRNKLAAAAAKYQRWAFLALFLVAATPLPDEPVVVPLGILRYSPAKFSLAYFAGKFLIASIGAYLGRAGQGFLGQFMGQEAMIILSIVLTVLITVLLVKVDIWKLWQRITKRNPHQTGVNCTKLRVNTSSRAHYSLCVDSD